MTSQSPVSDSNQSSGGPVEDNSPKKAIIAGTFLVAASVIVILAGIRAAQDLVGPFFLAIFLAVVLLPVLHWLQTKGFSEITSFLIVGMSALIVGIMMIWILAGSISTFVAKTPQYKEKINTTLTDVDAFLGQFGFSLTAVPFDSAHENELPKTQKSSEKSAMTAETAIAAETAATDTEAAKTDAIASNEPDQAENATEVAAAVDSDEPADDDEKLQHLAVGPISTVAILGYIQWFAGELGKLATLASLVLIMFVFMVLEASRLPKKIVTAFGTKGITNEHLQKISDKIWRYMLIKTIISFFTGLFTFAFLWFWGVEYAILWGLLAFFFNFIPNFGPIIASVPPIALAFFDHGMFSCIVVTSVLVVINWVLGYYFEPKYLGDGLGISPLIVLLSLIFWGWLLGPIGMFLSAPLSIVVKIIFDSFEDTRWVGILMED